MKWYLNALRHYADFAGRAGRKEYWIVVLFNFLFTVLAITLDNLLGWTFGKSPYGILFFYYSVILLIPGIALNVRRLHDTGRKGWMLLVGLIPLVGGIWLLVLMLLKGEDGENKFGPPSDPNFYNPGQKVRNAAVALIIAYGLNILSILTSEVEMLIDVGYIDMINFFTNKIIPVGMLLFGVGLLPKYRQTKFAPVALIISASYWLYLFLSNHYKMLSGGYMFNLLTALCMAITPLVLLLIGIRMYKEKTDMTYLPILLVVGCCINLLVGGWEYVRNMQYVYYNMSLDSGFILLYLKCLSVPSKIALILFSFSDAWKIPFSAGKEKSFKPVQPAQSREDKLQQKTNEKLFYERDNRRMRVETFEQSLAYWMGERMQSTRKDPFVYYVFENAEDAKKAFLELSFISMAADSRKLICTELFRFGYFAVTNNGVLTGEYDAFITGADLTHSMWEKIHKAFAKHNGRKKNDLEPDKKEETHPEVSGNADNVTFIREDRENTSVWRVHKALTKADAMAFLATKQVTRPLFYIVVETPEGNFGKDISGFYQE